MNDLPSSRLVNYKPGQLQGSIFGLHMRPKHESKIIQWFEEAGHKNIFFKKAQLSEHDFRLVLIDV